MSGDVGAAARRDLPLLEIGLRPFFLLGAAWAVVALGLWLAALQGVLRLGGPHGALIWHGHEMIYGFAGAILAGFLLTAIPSWTGRPALSGAALGLLAAVWLAGRLAMAGGLPAAPAAALDLAFFALLFALALRQVVAGRNWRNLPVSLAPGVLLAGNGLVHLAALGGPPAAALGNRIGIAVFVFLVVVIGGRIIPAFTRNWLNAGQAAGALPVAPNRFDGAVVAATLVTLVAWLAAPAGAALAALAAATAVGHAARLARWRGWRTTREPLVWILHLAYAWVPVAFGLMALSAAWPSTVPESAALHALTAGVVTTMMLAMMTRAALGHTGRALTADSATVAIYLLASGAAAARVIASLAPTLLLPLVAVAGSLSIAAFALYLASYGPKLCRGRAPARVPTA
jgi:uncharacterized protein involved in response to NO